MRHFLDIKDFDKERLSALLDTARDMKSGHDVGRPLNGLHIGMIFEKPSTRTRVSFEVGISQLGGTPVFLAASDLQLGPGRNSWRYSQGSVPLSGWSYDQGDEARDAD